MDAEETLMRPALFLDRDGVINVDIHFAYRPDQITFIPGIFEAIKLANDAGYYVLVVTNQSGIARGLYTEDDVRHLHAWMAEQAINAGARIDGFAYCPHHPEGQGAYKKDCECRKPKPGMINEFINTYNIDRTRSVLIGDKDTDIQAAEAVGIRGILFKGGDIFPVIKNALLHPQYT